MTSYQFIKNNISIAILENITVTSGSNKMDVALIKALSSKLHMSFHPA